MAQIIEYSVNTGEINMSKDMELLDYAIKNLINEPIIRFYGWSPKCVSLGRNQDINSINTKYCIEHKIDIVKRITGGRGLLHDRELTYSFICPTDFLKNGESVINSYKEISSAIIEGFKQIGIELTTGGKKRGTTGYEYCMLLATGADLCYKGKKLIGSAQYRKQNYILQHGSILFNYNPSEIEKIFSESVDTNTITCINEINTALTRIDIAEILKEEFKNYFSISYV